jgi:hypothetical protein
VAGVRDRVDAWEAAVGQRLGERLEGEATVMGIDVQIYGITRERWRAAELAVAPEPAHTSSSAIGRYRRAGRVNLGVGRSAVASARGKLTS